MLIVVPGMGDSTAVTDPLCPERPERGSGVARDDLSEARQGKAWEIPVCIVVVKLPCNYRVVVSKLYEAYVMILYAPPSGHRWRSRFPTAGEGSSPLT